MLRFFILISFIGIANIQAQQILTIHATDRDSQDVKQWVPYPDQISDSNAVKLTLNKTLSALFAKGFVQAYVINIKNKQNHTLVALHLGQQIKWGRIEVADDVLNSRELSRVKSLSGRVVDLVLLESIFNQLLRYYENNGYPFASVRLKQTHEQDHKLYADLWIDKGNLILIDSIAIIGDVAIANQYIQNYINIKKNSLYNEELIRSIPQKISELPFIEILKEPSINFFTGKAIVTLYLKKKNANRFDFIIGVLPNSSLIKTSGKILITGDIQMNLQNALGSGEQLSLRFEKFQARTTRARARVVYPYVLSTPFGVDAGFNLFVNDSIFRNLEYDVGVQYLYTGGNYIKGYFKRFESRLIYIDTLAIIFSKKLPPTLDVNNSTYGIEYAYDKTDFRFNPRKGYGFILNGAVGLRHIEPNLKIVNLKDSFNPEYSFNTLYDSIQTKGNQYRITVRAYKYWPIFSHSTLKTQFDAGYIIGQNIVLSELFRLGGNKSLRGFDEESILVSSYQIFNIEYRLLMDRFSYLSLFTDIGMVNRLSSASYNLTYPTGFGAGFTFNTKAGIFNISYALGHTESMPISFRAAKIHFGYINIF